MKVIETRIIYAKTFLDLFAVLLDALTVILFVIQMSLINTQDNFNDQSVLNICWAISAVLHLVVLNMKPSRAIARKRNSSKIIKEINMASFYIRQGNDAN